MALDSFTEVRSRSWGRRIVGSITGILVGLILIAVTIGLLWWNEGRAVKRARALDEGLSQVVSVAANRVDPANEGQLTHVSGRADTPDILTDPEFGLSAQALKLRRIVEMYQWQEQSRSETREKLGGGTETVTTYSYRQGWSSDLIDSAHFKQPEGHRNPPQMPYGPWSEVASPVELGAFRLSSAQLARLDDYRRVSLAGSARASDGLRLPQGAQLIGDLIYLGRDSSAPSIGDVKIHFEAIDPQDISLVAVQQGDSFKPYQASNGSLVSLLDPGIHSAEAMFKAAQDRNRALTWGLRLLGLVLMFIGVRLLFGTLRALAAVVPALGRLVGAAIGVVAGIIAGSISLITIALAWLFYRPLLGIGLLVAALALLFGLKRAASAKTQAPPAAAAAPPPPPPA